MATTEARRETRTRILTWEDPAATAAEAMTRPGLEFLEAMRDGRVPIPPIAELMGFTGMDVAEGWAEFRVAPQEYHYNPIGLVHGGLAATLIDTATGCAVQTLLPAGTGYTTVDLQLHFVRPITLGTGEITCTGEVVHRGRKVSVAEAKLTDARGKLLARGTATLLILSAANGA